MPVPPWLPEFLRTEAEHLKLAANHIEEQPVPVAWRGMIQRLVDRDRRLAEVLEKAAQSGSESEIQRAWECLLDASSLR